MMKFVRRDVKAPSYERRAVRLEAHTLLLTASKVQECDATDDAMKMLKLCT